MTRIPNLDELLFSDNENSSIIELDNFIGDLCDYGEAMENLTEQQMLFYLNQNLEREVNNGGFNQYFVNSSGDYAHETIGSLKAIGANITADILQKAIDQFPGKTVPKERDERIEIVEQIEEKADVVWEALTQEFFEYKDNLNSLNMNYIRQNKSQF